MSTTASLAMVRAALVIGACLAISSVASAQVRHARTFVTWDAALEGIGCRSRGATLVEVERRLGRGLGAPSRDESDLTLAVRLERSDARGSAVVLTLARTDGEVLGTRRIDTGDPRCGTLDDALPLVVAMLVDLHERDAQLVLPPVAPPPSAPPPVAPPPSAPASEGTTSPTEGGALAPLAPVAPREAPVEGSLEIGASIDVGLLPDAIVAPEIVSGIGRDDDVWAGMFRAALVAPDASEHVWVYGAHAAAGPCAYGRLTGVSLGGCALLDVGWIHAEGRGFDVVRGVDVPALAIDALLEMVLLALAPVTVRAEIGISAPLIAPRFVFDTSGDESTLFRSSPVTMRGGLFVGLTSQ